MSSNNASKVDDIESFLPSEPDLSPDDIPEANSSDSEITHTALTSVDAAGAVQAEEGFKNALAKELEVSQELLANINPEVARLILARVTRLQNIVKELESRPDLDDLTQTFRRGAGLAAISREMDKARRGTISGLVIAFIDVDGLKTTNDTKGHAAGDAVIRSVASVIRHSLRPYDIVLRYGGDEFVCALPDTSFSDGVSIFTRIADLVGDQGQNCSISVGLASFKFDDDLEHLLERADQALYKGRSKARRNRRANDQSLNTL